MSEYEWTIEKMVTQDRAECVAFELFRDEYASGNDCRNETGREGQSCRICTRRNSEWAARVAQVRAAMVKAFS